MCDENGNFLFWADEHTARRLLSRRAAALVRDSEGPKLLARRREIYEGPDNGLGWLRAARHWPDAFDAIAARERKAILKLCLEGLTRPQRTVIYLRYRQELRFKQIAAVLEVTEEAIGQMHGRALLSLREALERLGICKLDHIL